MTGTREVLLLTPNPSSPALGLATHWTIVECDDVGEAARLMRENHYRVGMIHVAKHDWDIDEAMQRLFLADARTRWIALVEREEVNPYNMLGSLSGWFHDYHSLPAEPTILSHTLGHAYGMAELSTFAQGPPREPEDNGMLGSSEPMRQLFAQIDRCAQSDAPVLITSEIGTGKKMVAQAIHTQSTRRDCPCVDLNCSTLPPELIQSEIFGYYKEAGAQASDHKSGKIQAAHGGTLFLDEIGDLPLESQAGLLRFLQEGSIYPVGGSRKTPVNVRVICATHTDLEQAVIDGRFREDLYFRLRVIRIEIPPLRKRGQDILHLARFFLRQSRLETGARGTVDFTSEAVAAILHHPWPGNVQELISRIRRAVLMSDHLLLAPTDLELGVPQSTLSSVDIEDARRRAELRSVCTAMQMSNNNVTKAAEVLGISRRTLYRLMDRLEFDNGPYEQGEACVRPPPER